MLWRTPTAFHIVLRPGVHFKPIKGNALLANGNFREAYPNLPVESVLVHSQVAGGITQTNKSWKNRSHLSAPQVDSSDLLSDMAQLFAYRQAGLMVPSSLSLAEFCFGRPTRMGCWPARELLVALLGIGVAQAMHFRQPGIGGVALVDSQLLDVLAATRD